MNLQQLEYLVTVAETGQFVEAANRCHVTQATLSAMLKKLEEELGIRLIDRSRQPVKATPAGQAIVKQAQLVLLHANALKLLADELQGSTAGTYRMRIIPTLSGSLLPLLLPHLLHSDIDYSLDLKEVFTAEMISQLKEGEADFGILAGPIEELGLTEIPLFDEAFYLLASPDIHQQLPSPINLNLLPEAPFWLLEEGHCLRHQMLLLCNHVHRPPGITYQAGNTETLIRLVNTQGGMTLVPALQLSTLSNETREQIKEFEAPMPVRRISLVFREDYPRKKFLNLLQISIRNAVTEVEGVWIEGQAGARRVIPIQ